MNARVNFGLGPPPLATPITAQGPDQTGIPYQLRSNPRGDLHTAWGQWFNQLGVNVQSFVVNLRDTVANMVNYPASNYPPGSFYQESDRNDVTYVDRTGAGTVNTSGTAVTWASGDMFSASLPGTPIVIAGTTYAVATVAGPTSLTLTSSAGINTGANYSTALQEWRYVSGTWNAPLASLPTLGALDIGFRFWDTDHLRLFAWSTQGGAPSSTSPGWIRGNGELPTGAINPLPYNAGYAAAGWSLCDGSAVSITQDDATTTSVNTANLVGAYAKGITSTGYSGSQVAAVAPQISGHTNTGTASITDTAVTINNPAAGGTPASVATHNTEVDAGHQHNLSAANAPISLSGGDPVNNVGIAFYMKR